MAQQPDLDFVVAYCSLHGSERYVDPGFNTEIQWDIPLLDDYPWIYVPNRTSHRAMSGFLRLLNPDLWYLIQRRKFDAVIIHVGYTVISFWIALIAAKLAGSAVMFGTDAHTLKPRDGKKWKHVLKAWTWSWLFRLADIVIVPSSGGLALMQALKLPEKRVALMPYVVDNDWWTRQAALVDREGVRASWNIPADGNIILFSGKLQPWKRPQDALRAFAEANVPQSWLVFAGDGALRQELEQLAQTLQVAERVRFLGFVNQSQLPAIYVASDVLVFPSVYEPFGVVVNEMMLCGHPVIASDQVGARFDLIRHAETGFVFPCGDVPMLATMFRRVFADRNHLTMMGQRAQHQMARWSIEVRVQHLTQAVARAVSIKQTTARRWTRMGKKQKTR
jgi:glycosyltransferase involved in cell wall biosynthesis